MLIFKRKFWFSFFLIFLSFFSFFFLITLFLLKNGMTALHIAAFKGFEQIVKILVEHGSNVHLRATVLIFFLFIFICCCGFIVGLFHVDCEWLCCVDIYFVFILFLNNFLFVKGWRDRSSLCYFQRFWTNCENSCWTWIQCSSSKYSFQFLFLFLFFFLMIFILFLCFFSFFYLLLWFILCCFMLCEWLCWYLFCFYSFFNNFLFVKGWVDALHLAALNGFEQIVKILIEHGSNVNLQTEVFIFFFYLLLLWVHCWFVSCWLWMVVLCDISFVFILFSTTFFLLKYGKTALHYAAEKGFEQIIKILIEHRSNIHLQNKVFIFFFLFPFLLQQLICWIVMGGWVGGWWEWGVGGGVWSGFFFLKLSFLIFWLC